MMEKKLILDSWKEIAAYLGRSVKTCRRWEHELSLPVHRLEDSPKARVFTYKDELDQWINSTLKKVERSKKKTMVSSIKIILSKIIPGRRKKIQ